MWLFLSCTIAFSACIYWIEFVCLFSKESGLYVNEIIAFLFVLLFTSIPLYGHPLLGLIFVVILYISVQFACRTVYLYGYYLF